VFAARVHGIQFGAEGAEFGGSEVGIARGLWLEVGAEVSEGDAVGVGVGGRVLCEDLLQGLAGREAGAAGVDGGDGFKRDFVDGEDVDEANAAHTVLIADFDVGSLPASETEGGGAVLNPGVEG